MRKKLALAILFLIFLTFLPLLIYNLLFWGKIFPNISVAGVNLAGRKPQEAAYLLSEKIKKPEKITLISPNQNFDLETKSFDLNYDFNVSSENAFNLTRTGNVLYDLGKVVKLLVNPQNLGLEVSLNEEKLTKIISVIDGQISQEPVFPSAQFVKGELIIQKGSPGAEIDRYLLRARLGEGLSYAKSEPLEIPLKTIDPRLTESEESAFRQTASRYKGKALLITFEFNTYSYNDNEILATLDAKGGLNKDSVDKIVFKIASQINRSPQNPKFTFLTTGEAGAEGKVKEFLPALDGIELEAEAFREKLREVIDDLSQSQEKSLTFAAPVIRTPPEITTDKVNNLGIKELIGRGTSRFRGSIPSRVHNITVASARLNGILIKPGDIFSFNEALGDVSKFTGYKEAYVIKEGKTVLGDGGGVCQVSTTFFRAALNAGLPILERQAHAYRVGYYEQDSLPGLDATVYAPTPDLKVKNDTPAHILIQSRVDPKNYSLVFEFYGTSDGRVAKTSKPIVTNVTPPPDDLYIDDPTIPAGSVKKIEHKAWGAKAFFNYRVERNGQAIFEKKFISNYRPWQAVYLRGTGPVN